MKYNTMQGKTEQKKTEHDLIKGGCDCLMLFLRKNS